MDSQWKKMHIVMGDVDNEETMECGGMSVWKISVLFAQFCYDPKMTIKIKLSFKKNEFTSGYVHSKHLTVDYYSYFQNH